MSVLAHLVGLARNPSSRGPGRRSTLGRRAVACAFIIAASSLVAAQSGLPRGDAAAAGLDPVKLKDATALLQQFVADQKIAGAVAAVARHGRVAYLESVGVQDLETRTPMAPTSLFRIYSMTKPVTAVAAMMLHEGGRFSLEDPVAKYLPEFDSVMVVSEPGAAPRKPSAPITVRDLLLHTSGLSHRTSELYRSAKVRSRSFTMPAFIQNITRTPLMEDPGSRFRYSEATTVLGRLVEVWSGQSFESFLETKLFKPLRMSDTVFVVDAARTPRFAAAYAPAPGGGLSRTDTEELPFTERPQLIEGAVGLVSTVPDYLRFCQMLLNKGELDGARVLQPATVERMTANGLSDAVRAVRGGSMGWGLANVNVVMDKASRLYGEYGWDGTAGTIFWNDPARGMITILMTQSVPSNPDGIRQKFKAIVQSAIVK